MRPKKATVPDGVPLPFLTFTNSVNPSVLHHLYNSCYSYGLFPLEWKTAKLILMKKKSPDSDPTPKYRPRTLLSIMGKIYERIFQEFKYLGGSEPTSSYVQLRQSPLSLEERSVVYKQGILPKLSYGVALWGLDLWKTAISKKITAFQRSFLLRMTKAFPTSPGARLDIIANVDPSSST